MTALLHDKTKKLFDTLFAKLSNGEDIVHPFWLICGEKNTGKSTVVRQYVSDLLGVHATQDLLYIQDFSAELGKEHSLKVEMKKNEMSEELAKTYSYNDRGVREIKERFVRSPLGNYKVLFLENVERMTISAANALLKTIEEPGEGRLIIATTSSLSSLLDTIASRALLIKFLPPTTEAIAVHLAAQYPNLSKSDLDLIVQLSHGKIGFAVTLAGVVTSESDDGLLGFVTQWKKFLALRQQSTLVSLNQFLQASNKAGFLQDLLTMIHYDAIQKNLFGLADHVLRTKQYLANNVSTEASMTRLSLQLLDSFRAA